MGRPGHASLGVSLVPGVTHWAAAAAPALRGKPRCKPAPMAGTANRPAPTTCSWRRCCWRPSLPRAWRASPLPAVEAVLRRMLDALAASLDGTGQPPRFGDSDDARGLLVDAPATDADSGPAGRRARACSVRTRGGRRAAGSVLGSIAASVPAPRPTRSRPCIRPALFPSAGMAILRSGAVWLRCDAGPHGYGSIAAHGHADALSIELRCDGRRGPGRPRHVLLSRRACVAGLLPRHAGALHAERGRPGPGGAGRPVPVADTPAGHARGMAARPGVAGSHDGYAPARHHRRVTLDGLSRHGPGLDRRRRAPPGPAALPSRPEGPGEAWTQPARGLRWPGGSADWHCPPRSHGTHPPGRDGPAARLVFAAVRPARTHDRAGRARHAAPGTDPGNTLHPRQEKT